MQGIQLDSSPYQHNNETVILIHLVFFPNVKLIFYTLQFKSVHGIQPVRLFPMQNLKEAVYHSSVCFLHN